MTITNQRAIMKNKRFNEVGAYLIKTTGEVTEIKPANEKDFSLEELQGYVVDMANHLTAVEDGTIIDTWNCGHKSIGNWWAKETELKNIKNLF